MYHPSEGRHSKYGPGEPHTRTIPGIAYPDKRRLSTPAAFPVGATFGSRSPAPRMVGRSFSSTPPLSIRTCCCMKFSRLSSPARGFVSGGCCTTLMTAASRLLIATGRPAARRPMNLTLFGRLGPKRGITAGRGTVTAQLVLTLLHRNILQRFTVDFHLVTLFYPTAQRSRLAIDSNPLVGNELVGLATRAKARIANILVYPDTRLHLFFCHSQKIFTSVYTNTMCSASTGSLRKSVAASENLPGASVVR